MLKTMKLPNGLEVIAAPIAGAKTTTVLAMFATGSKFENKKNSGVSHFLEHMFFKGTVKRPNTLAIASELDGAGGEFNAFTGKEYTGYFVKVESSRIELAMDVLSDMLLNSKFDQEEIGREKNVIIEELNMYIDNPIMHIEDLFEQCLYGDTPAGRDTIGSKKSISEIARRDLFDYYNSQYSSDKAVVCLAGQAGAEEIELAKKYFQPFGKKKYSDKKNTDNSQSRAKAILHFKKTDQAHLSLGVRAFQFAEKDEIAAKIISVILGGAMSSRLFTELRERRGLAYYVRTHSEPYSDSGYLTTQAGVPIEKAPEAVKIILDEYKKISEQSIGEEELNRVKQCVIGRSAISLESSDSLANWYGRQAVLFKQQKTKNNLLTPEKYYDIIGKINSQDIRRAAEKIFVEKNLNLAVIGPYKNNEKFEKMLKF